MVLCRSTAIKRNSLIRIDLKDTPHYFDKTYQGNKTSLWTMTIRRRRVKNSLLNEDWHLFALIKYQAVHTERQRTNSIVTTNTNQLLVLRKSVLAIRIIRNKYSFRHDARHLKVKGFEQFMTKGILSNEDLNSPDHRTKSCSTSLFFNMTVNLVLSPSCQKWIK